MTTVLILWVLCIPLGYLAIRESAKFVGCRWTIWDRKLGFVFSLTGPILLVVCLILCVGELISRTIIRSQNDEDAPW